jgi:pyruvate dehydrogenase E1 component alpha subunit
MTTQIKTDTRLESMLEAMMLIRAFEESNAALQAEGKAGGTCTAVGQEAAAVGVVRALSTDDVILTNHRSAGHLLARGADPGRMLAEILGRRDGYCGGKSGTLHISVKELGILLTSTIVGGELTLAPGVALSRTMLTQPGIVVCFFGDGAACEGAFHESLNLAALWRLPIVYVVINNGMGMGTPVDKASAEPDLYKRGCSYRMPGERVDGDDVLAVRDAARAALDRARTERQPGLLEAVSYRLRGHSVVDPARYRSKEETERLRTLDPVPAFRLRLLEAGILDEDEARRVDEQAEEIVDAAVAFADGSPDPHPGQLFEHAYATPVANAPRLLPGDPVVSPA